MLSKLKKYHRITAFDIIVFIRQFSALLTAGIPILQCCEILEKSQVKTDLRLLIFSIKQELLSGKDFYSSLSCHDNYFDAITCQLVKIGEYTGNMDVVLNMIAKEKEKQVAFKSSIKQALFYPCIITIAAIIVTLSMFLFVIPRFAELFASTHVQLPLLTRIIFFLSLKLQQYIYILFVPAFAIMMLFIPNEYFRKFKRQALQYLVKLPFLQPFLRKIILARFARNLAMAFSAGVPITDALKLVMHISSHPEFTFALIKLRNKIYSGLQLHQAMQSLPFFPDLMIQMIKIGEESGSLDHLLLKLAGFFESDTELLLNQFSKLLEPLIMLVLGALIGGLVIAMYLPIFNLGNAL